MWKRIFLVLLLTVPAAAAPDLSAEALLRDHLWRELREAAPERRLKVGLVLSAGSLRGVAHVGVIQALEDAGFPVDVVSGTSMGAVMGSMYATGLPLKKLWEVGAGMRLTTGNDLSKRRLISLVLFDELLSSENAEKMLRTGFGSMRFDQAPKPFACVAMDVYTGEAIIFHEGEIAPAVRASMNLPGLFKPVEYRHRYLVDGGVVDYIPVDAARLLGAEWTLASVTETDYTVTRPRSVLESLMQVIDIRGAYLSREQRKQADFLIEPPVGDIGMFDEHRAVEAIEKGLSAASARLTAAKDSLILASFPRLSGAWLLRKRP